MYSLRYFFIALVILQTTTAIPEGRSKWSHGFASRRHGDTRSSMWNRKGSSYSHIACIARTLVTRDTTEDPFSTATLTPSLEECSKSCHDSGYFGVTSNNECYCENTLPDYAQHQETIQGRDLNERECRSAGHVSIFSKHGHHTTTGGGRGSHKSRYSNTFLDWLKSLWKANPLNTGPTVATMHPASGEPDGGTRPDHGEHNDGIPNDESAGRPSAAPSQLAYPLAEDGAAGGLAVAPSISSGPMAVGIGDEKPGMLSGHAIESSASIGIVFASIATISTMTSVENNGAAAGLSSELSPFAKPSGSEHTVSVPLVSSASTPRAVDGDSGHSRPSSLHHDVGSAISNSGKPSYHSSSPLNKPPPSLGLSMLPVSSSSNPSRVRDSSTLPTASISLLLSSPRSISHSPRPEIPALMIPSASASSLVAGSSTEPESAQISITISGQIASLPAGPSLSEGTGQESVAPIPRQPSSRLSLAIPENSIFFLISATSLTSGVLLSSSNTAASALSLQLSPSPIRESVVTSPVSLSASGSSFISQSSPSLPISTPLLSSSRQSSASESKPSVTRLSSAFSVSISEPVASSSVFIQGPVLASSLEQGSAVEGTGGGSTASSSMPLSWALLSTATVTSSSLFVSSNPPSQSSENILIPISLPRQSSASAASSITRSPEIIPTSSAVPLRLSTEVVDSSSQVSLVLVPLISTSGISMSVAPSSTAASSSRDSNIPSVIAQSSGPSSPPSMVSSSASGVASSSVLPSKSSSQLSSSISSSSPDINNSLGAVQSSQALSSSFASSSLSQLSSPSMPVTMSSTQPSSSTLFTLSAEDEVVPSLVLESSGSSRSSSPIASSTSELSVFSFPVISQAEMSVISQPTTSSSSLLESSSAGPTPTSVSISEPPSQSRLSISSGSSRSSLTSPTLFLSVGVSELAESTASISVAMSSSLPSESSLSTSVFTTPSQGVIQSASTGSAMPVSSVTSSDSPASLTATMDAAVESSSPVALGYVFENCWTEGSSGRLFSGAETSSDAMTIELCAAFCTVWPYFGVEYSRECFCGMAPTSGSIAPLTDCNMPCSGDSTQTCGGPNRLSVYHDASKTGPQAPPTVGGSVRLGCYAENHPRVLDGPGTSSDTMSLEQCSTFCTGYTFWGVEFGRECFCNNAITPGSTQVSLGECDKQCVGSATEFCGAADRVLVYQRT